MTPAVRTASALALGWAALAGGAADAAGGGSSGSAAESVSGTVGGGAGTTGGSAGGCAAAACVGGLGGTSLSGSRCPLAKISSTTASAAAASARISALLLFREDGAADARAISRAPSRSAWAAGSAARGFVVPSLLPSLSFEGSGVPSAGFSAVGGAGRWLARISSSS